MISLANLRASSAPWLLLPALLYVSVSVKGDNFWGAPGYGPASGELASSGIAAIAPVVAAGAAWEAGRQRRLGELRKVGARSMVGQWFWAVAPLFALQILLVVGALTLARSAVGVWPNGVGLLGVLHLLILPCGWMIIGWVVGLLCPRAIAAPLAAAGCWAWLSVTPSLDDPTWRHLGGFVTEGSTLTDLLDPLVYVIPWLVVAGFAVAAALLTGVRRRPWLLAISALVAAGTLVGGVNLVQDWKFSPLTQPRIGHTACAGASPMVCVPEEYAKDAGEVRSAAIPVLATLHAAGLPEPKVLRLASGDLSLEPGTWPLYWSPDMSAVAFKENMARSAVSGVAALAGVRDCQQPSTAQTWALLNSGLDEATVRQGVMDTTWAQVHKIRALPADEQTQWFTDTVRGQKYCATELS